MTETSTNRLRTFWNESPPAPWSPLRHVVELIAVFAAAALVMTFIYAGTGGVNGDEIAVPGYDSFYHTKMAMLLPEIGLVDTFPWLTTTIFADKFVSHHYGFHALLVPFIKASEWFADGDPLRGARWGITFCFGVSAVLFDLLLLAGRVRYRPVWWVMFLLMPNQFFGRHVFVRAICPSLMCVLALLLAMFRRRYVLAGVVVFLYTQIYLGSVVYSPVIVCAYFVAGLIGSSGDRVSWKLAAWTAGGWLLGLAVHPYGGWDAVEFLRIQVLGTGLAPDIPVGREWKSYSPAWFFAEMSGVTLLLSGAAICVRFRRGPRLDARELALLLLNFVFVGLTLKARRFIEYWPVLSVLSSAYLCGPLLTRRDPAVQAEESKGARVTQPHLPVWAVAAFAVAMVTAAVVMSKRFDLSAFAGEWQAWLWAVGWLCLGPACCVWCRRVSRSLWVSIGGVWLTVGVAAFVAFGVAALSLVLAGRELPDAKISVGWLWGVLAAGYVIAPLVGGRLSGLSRATSDEESSGRVRAAARFVCGGAGLCLICFAFASPMLVGLQNSSRCGFHLAAVRDAMGYLKEHSAEGDIVFTDDWDIFGLYFFHNHHNRYIVGLDPKFTHERDPELWDRYTRITQAKTPTTMEVEREDESGVRHTEKVAVKLADIRDAFHAKWVIVDEDHRSFARKLLKSPEVAERVYVSPFKTSGNVPRYEIYRVMPVGEGG